METTATTQQRPPMQPPSEPETAQQAQSNRLKEIKQQGRMELLAAEKKHAEEMKSTEAAYQVELSAQKEEFSRKLSELQLNQNQRLTELNQVNETNFKQAQETYRQQAEQLIVQGEKKLNSIRQQQSGAAENINKKAAPKGNA